MIEPKSTRRGGDGRAVGSIGKLIAEHESTPDASGCRKPGGPAGSLAGLGRTLAYCASQKRCASNYSTLNGAFEGCSSVYYMTRSTLPRSVRLPERIDASLDALIARTGTTYTAVFEAAISRYIAEESVTHEADLIEALDQDFLAATFTLSIGDEIAVAVSDVERRSADPQDRERSGQAPLTQVVSVEARREPGGRATIELVGLPGTTDAGTRVFVATVPAQPGVSVTVQLMDLHPVSRPVDDAVEGAES